MRKENLKFKLVYNPDWVYWWETNRVYEPEVLECMLRFVRPGDRVIDAGANLGLFSLCLSQMVGPEGEVYAFEPDNRFFDELVRNIHLNNTKNVCCYKQALWYKEENLRFNSVSGGGYSSFIYFTDEKCTPQGVTALPLDTLMNTDCFFRLLKVDCEGSEECVLRGAEQLLRKGIDAVIVELNFYLMQATGSTEKSIRDYMHGLGYDFFFLHKDGSEPLYVPNYTSISIKNDVHLVNVLFSTREKVAQVW